MVHRSDRSASSLMERCDKKQQDGEMWRERERLREAERVEGDEKKTVLSQRDGQEQRETWTDR